MSSNSELRVSLQDYSLIDTIVKKDQQDNNLAEKPNAFYFFALNLILALQDDEIRDSITDTFYLKSIGSVSGHDRGIDAIYVDDSDIKAIIHVFNFKYANSFEKTKNNFPSSEIDKILSFLNSLMQKDMNLQNDVNPILYSKVEEIWKIFDSQNPEFVFHICANYYRGFEKKEKERFEREINLYSNFDIKYHLMPDLVRLITRQGKKIVNGQIRAIDKNFFEKSEGDIRALVVNIDVKDLIRIVLDNDEIRNQVDLDDYEKLKKHEILEDAFEDNVRIYLKQRSKINRNIKNTALSDENYRFFYFNNGITITCSEFSYPKNRRAPIVEIKNIQVVNGSQTIHALYDAFVEDPSKFEDIDILCRIYQTRNLELSTQIAEYTNSQNPVKSRDIRSIDFTQQKLEQEFLAKGLYYERKKNQYQDKAKNLRIDAEKSGQVLMALYNKMPAEAKSKKRLIFADKYDEIFNDSINADRIFIAYTLFEKIENEKNKKKENILSNPKVFEKKSYILYCSYHILFILGQLSELNKIDLSPNKIDNIWKFYPNTIEIIEEIIKNEQGKLKEYKDIYTHYSFFKYNKPQQYFEDMLNSGKLEKFIETES